MFLQPTRALGRRSVRTAFSVRSGGVSVGPYASLNLGAHVGDDPVAVAENRRRLRRALALPSEPLWLSQQHGIDVVDADRTPSSAESAPAGDAAVTREPGRVLAVLVADCLPVLLADEAGRAVAVAHAGWRGLSAGVIEAAIGGAGNRPAASSSLDRARHRSSAFRGRRGGARGLLRNSTERRPWPSSAIRAGRWQCDLYRLVEQRLARAGVTRVAGERRCTYAEAAAVLFVPARWGRPDGWRR